MSISYHGIVGFGSGKATLPSVETWSSNMNILRDPPKSIYTRKIDKVGQTSNITQMIDDSSDRACESILVYARGKNPMVAVSYDNYGNNGGQKAGNQSGFNANGKIASQAFLPYRIMDKGAFRPPIRDQRDLLPLSRLPRATTSSFTKAGFVDFSKKALCQSETGKEYRNIKNEDQMLKASIRPTAVYQLETPITENYEVKYVIKNPVQIQGFSGIQPSAKFNGEIGDVTKIVENPLRMDVNVNQAGEYAQNIDISNFNTDKYTHDVLYTDRDTNISKNIGITDIEDIINIDMNKSIRDNINIDYQTTKTSYDKYDYIHSDIDLERSLPYYESRTNSGLNIHKSMDNQKTERSYILNRPNTEAITNIGGNHLQKSDNISSRNYNLKPTINAGGFDCVPTLKQTYHENNILDIDTHKSKMRRSVYEMQQDRNMMIGNNQIFA